MHFLTQKLKICEKKDLRGAPPFAALRRRHFHSPHFRRRCRRQQWECVSESQKNLFPLETNPENFPTFLMIYCFRASVLVGWRPSISCDPHFSPFAKCLVLRDKIASCENLCLFLLPFKIRLKSSFSFEEDSVSTLLNWIKRKNSLAASSNPSKSFCWFLNESPKIPSLDFWRLRLIRRLEPEGPPSLVVHKLASLISPTGSP